MTGRRPASAPRPQHADGFHSAVTSELVRLTLGGRPARPELVAARPGKGRRL